MGFWDKLFGTENTPVVEDTPPTAPKSYYSGENYGNMMPVVTYDGEKTPFEMGRPLHILPDFNGLRMRAHEADLKSDVVKIINNKIFRWVIGSGLKIQSEPVERVLKQEKVNFADMLPFKEAVESRFNFWARQKEVDYNGQCNLHSLANNQLKTKFLGGDVLIVLRIIDMELTVQVIDGQQVKQPYLHKEYLDAAKQKGNTIRHGVEKDPQGRHVAYYVLTEKPGSVLGEYERIPVFGEKTNRKMAWMVYFDKHRIDHDRGIGGLTTVLEKIEKLDRMTEATVAGAEERAKIPFFFTHNRDSDGESPLDKKVRASISDNAFDYEDSYAKSELKAKDMHRTTGKTVINMPVGSDIKTPSSGSLQIEYPEFWRAIFDTVSAAADIPPEVALQMYNSNYSASRAAVNAFQHLIMVLRERETNDFYQPIYEVWLEVEVLKNKIPAPGYLSALRSKKKFALKAYANSRFTGSNMPHIDPLKEVKAIREMLGSDMDHVSLIDLEQATEKVGGGSWEENHRKHETEKTKITPKQNEANV